MSYRTIVTQAGQARIAAAIAAGTDLNIAQMAFGDGNGTAIEPLSTRTGLVREVFRTGVQSVIRDGASPTWVKVTAIIPIADGPFTVREVGLYLLDGTFFAIGSMPATDKPTPAQGATTDMRVEMTIIVSDTANVTVTVNPGNFATQEYVAQLVGDHKVTIAGMARAPFLAVESATEQVPPSVVATGMTYVVAVGAALAWAGQDGKLAQWGVLRPGAAAAWHFVTAPEGTTVRTQDTDIYLARAAAGWEPIMATLAQHLSGASSLLFTNPAGVAAMISAQVSRGRLLFFGQG